MQTTTMTGPIGITESGNTEIAKQLTKILNTFYTSGIDRIKTYGKTSSGNIVGEFVAGSTSFQYIINPKTNTISYEPVGKETVNKADSLLAEQENADRFKAIYSARESFDVTDPSVIEKKLDSWFFHADAAAKQKVGAKTKLNKANQALTCTDGKTYPCGATCRAYTGKKCKQPLSPEVQKMVEEFAAKLKTATTTTPTKTPTVATTLTATSAATTAPSTSVTPGKVTAQKMAEQIAAAKTLEPDASKKPLNSSKLFTKLINTKRIEPPTKEFDANDLRTAAEASLELGGFVEPPVVRRIGNPLDQKYEVVSGQFQIAAAIVARAIDPLRGETINAIVIEEENEEAIKKQMKAQNNANKNN